MPGVGGVNIKMPNTERPASKNNAVIANHHFLLMFASPTIAGSNEKPHRLSPNCVTACKLRCGIHRTLHGLSEKNWPPLSPWLLGPCSKNRCFCGVFRNSRGPNVLGPWNAGIGLWKSVAVRQEL